MAEKKDKTTKSALNVMKGVEGTHDGLPDTKPVKGAAMRTRNPRRRELSVDEYVEGIQSGERTKLARAITLVESNSRAHQDQAQEVLKRIMPKTGKSTRVGISGVPGAGKSTFIEALGNNLVQAGHKVAVLAVDPSSTVTRGSILGDKTRMEKLSREENAFIRPSPSGGTLGGVARKTRETMMLFEAAGYDIILVETVGVGQSEITVRSMVDFFLLIQIAGAGDELQGIKKGVIEISDAILINKADGDNEQRAKVTRAEFDRTLHYLQPATEGWITHAFTASSLEGRGIDEMWAVVEKFISIIKDSGVFEKRRQQQARDWLHSMLQERVMDLFYENDNVKKILDEVENGVISGSIPATKAAWQLLKAFEGK